MISRSGLWFCAFALVLNFASATEYDEAVKLTGIVKSFGGAIRYYKDPKGNVIAVTPTAQESQNEAAPLNRFYWASDKKIFYQQDADAIAEGSNVYTLRDARFPEGARLVHNADKITAVCGTTNLVFTAMTAAEQIERNNALVYVFRFMPLSADAIDPVFLGKFMRAGKDMYVFRAVQRYPYRLGQADVTERGYRKLFYGPAGELEELTVEGNRGLAMYPHEGGEGYTDLKIGHFYFPSDVNKAELHPAQTIDAQGRKPLKMEFQKELMQTITSFREGKLMKEGEPELEKMRSVLGDLIMDRLRPVMLNTPCNGVPN